MFETDTRRYHLIDTPGIGDCRGTGKDKENFENILQFLTLYNKINAVVVLLKPNNPRLTVAFRFCVLELLTHLHKSLASNIIFAFTNSRGTFYKPGDSLPVLKELLQEYNLEIDVSPSNYFCFDNEAFRYLLLYPYGRASESYIQLVYIIQLYFQLTKRYIYQLCIFMIAEAQRSPD